MQALRVLSVTFALVLMSICSTGCASVSSRAEALVGKQTPDGRLMMLSGDDVALRPDDGRMKALLFWATWCPYSKSAIEQFEALARKYSSRDDVAFYAVSIDLNAEMDILEARIREQDLQTVNHVFSGNDIQDEAFLALEGNTIPYAVVISSDGVVRFVGIGAAGLSSYLDDALG